MAKLSTGVGVNGTAKLESNQVNRYSTGRENYFFFTARFTQPTSANSKQFIGLFNDTSGVAIGFNGLNFSLMYRGTGGDNFITRNIFSTDLLDGNPNSHFTRNGVAEPIDFYKFNSFRIRIGSVGSGTAYFEVLAPDGNWVLFHEAKLSNTYQIPIVIDPNLPARAEVTKTGADATDLSIYTTAWDAGTVDVIGAYGLEEINGRKYIDKNIYNQTTSQAVHINSAGRSFRLTSILISIENSAGVIGRLLIRDGSGGDVKIPIAVPPSTNQSSSGNNINSQFLVPLRFANGVYAEVVAGTLTYAMVIVGYEAE